MKSILIIKHRLHYCVEYGWNSIYLYNKLKLNYYVSGKLKNKSESEETIVSELKIYCMPYAGGSKSIYSNWIKSHADLCKIVPMEYKGHGELFSEPFYSTMEETVEDMYKRIAADSPDNYVIFGHSLGSIVALLTAEKLQKNYSKSPKALIVAGIRPPHLLYKDKKLGGLSKNEFMESFFELGQMDQEIMECPELIDIIYEILSNDVKIEENYKHNENEHDLLNIPIFAMTGIKDDEAPVEDIQEWGNYTTNSLTVQLFQSDHFFPFNCSDFEPYFRSIIKKIAADAV